MNCVFFVRKKKILIYEEENLRGKILFFVLLFLNLFILFKNGFKVCLRLIFVCNIVCK